MEHSAHTPFRQRIYIYIYIALLDVSPDIFAGTCPGIEKRVCRSSLGHNVLQTGCDAYTYYIPGTAVSYIPLSLLHACLFQCIYINANERCGVGTYLIPFRAAVPFWGQNTWNLTGLSPKPGLAVLKGYDSVCASGLFFLGLGRGYMIFAYVCCPG